MDTGDPGGGTGEGGSSTENQFPNQELNDLKGQYEQQQVLISQLKEMLRKNEQTTVTPEKVEEYANTLNRMRAKVKQGRLLKQDQDKDESKTPSESRRSSTVNIQAKEKILLLRQKVEENKAKLAKRDKDHKGLEELVTQLKAQLDDSQQFINQTPLNLSLAESNTKIENLSQNSSSEELYNALLLKEKRNVELSNKILDLQESLKEKDSVIDARTKAITLMSENLSKKNKLTVDQLEDTKEQMKHMQENFITLESQLNVQKQNLLKQLKEKNSEIEELKSKYEEIVDKNKELDELLKTNESGEKGSNKKGNKNVKLQTKIEELQKLVENKTEELHKCQNKISDLEIQLQKELDENKLLHTKITELESQIITQQIENENCTIKIKDLEEKLKNIDSNKSSESLHEDAEVENLKKQSVEYNKNMIKIKAQHKSKLKELNKKIEEFKKVSDSNAEIVRLNSENEKLKQQIAELETKVTENDSKNITTETDQLISTLQEEILSYKSQIAASKDQLENLSVLENAQVTSEINSIHLEERIDTLETEVDKLREEKEHISEENLNLLEKIEDLKREKQDISARLDQCLQENIDLIDKLEKLSAEKVSSAESIEIVEGLTQQEKIELEAYQQSLDVHKSEENLEPNIELNESVNQLTEETSDLLRKIELFTEERREVMEKMEGITSDNNQLQLKIKAIENNRDVLVETYEQLQNEKEELDNKFRELESENVDLRREIEDLKKDDSVEGKQKIETMSSSDSHDINKKLQEEIYEFKSLVDIQKQEIQDLKLQLLSSNTSDDLKEELSNLETQYEALLSENQKLKEAVKTNSELVHEKDSIEGQLRDALTKSTSLETKLNDALREINEYKIELGNKNNELNKLTHLKDKIEEQKAELLHYEKTVENLNATISDLMEKISEVDKLKEMFAKDMEHVEEYEKELLHNSQTISNLEGELSSLNNKILETEHLLESKDDEIRILTKEAESNKVIINDLRAELKNKDEQFHNAFGQIRERCLVMQNQIEKNQESMKEIRIPLEAKIHELEDKNKEQLEKMKKIAANLKKKTLQCQEIERQLAEKEKLQTDKDEKIKTQEQELQNLRVVAEELTQKLKLLEIQFDENDENQRKDEEIQHLRENLSMKLKSLEELQTENALLRSQINQYIAINDDLQQIKTDYETQISAFSIEVEIMRSNLNNSMNTEMNRKEEIIANLNNRLEALTYSNETSLNAAQAKVHELEAYIESQESELSKYKFKANKLEEGLSVVEERRASLEKKAIELGAELEEKSHSYEEISHTEDILEQRLSALLIHDEIIEKRLEETTHENNNLIERNRHLMDENARLRDDLCSASGKIVDVSDFIQKISFLENENSKLTEDAVNIENEFKRLQIDFNKKIFEKEQELDALDSELQNQIEISSNERKNLLVQSEHLQDQLKESHENQEMLQEELNAYENKLASMSKELQKAAIELNKLKIEHENALKEIKNHQENVSQNVNTPSVSSYFETTPQNFFLLNTSQSEEELKNNNVELEEANRKIQELTQEKKDLENTILQMEQEISNLKVELDKQLQARILSKKLVDEIVTTAEHKMSVKEESTNVQPLQQINWGSTTNDPFAFIQEPEVISERIQTQGKPSRNTNTTNDDINDLESKLKTLQFMLYNAEKERDEALAQCNQLTNELAQLIYEKENRRFSKDNTEVDSLQRLENLIVQPSESEISESDRQQLHNIEFTPVRFSESDSSQPVIEVVGPPKTAYLEYASQPETVDSLIIPSSETRMSDTDRKQLHDVEFTSIHFPENDGSRPVEEIVGPPKSAYLVYQGEGQTPLVTGDIFDNGDGWGWGPEETRIEDQAQSMNMLEIDSSVKIKHLEEQVRVLELDRERHLEEIRQLQIKAGKLIKKLKELKNQNEKLSSQKSQRSDNCGDLDNAIQEELKLLIENLDKKNKEINGELDKERREKKNLLKRVDVLTASHEKMIEVKEKQDIEMMGWQQKNRELASKLEQLEWGDGDHESPGLRQPKTVSHQFQAGDQELMRQINELNETIKDLTLDNEELQALLEEQRNLRLTLERSKSLEPSSENMKSEAEYQTLLSEHEKVKEKITTLENELHKTKDLLQKELKVTSELNKNISELSQQKQELDDKLKENYDATELQGKIEENNKLEFEEYKEKINSLENEKTELSNQLYVSNIENNNLNDMISECTKQVLSFEELLAKSKFNERTLEEQLVEKESEINNWKIQFESLNDKLVGNNEEISSMSAHINSLREQLQKESNEIAELHAQLEEKSKSETLLIEQSEKIKELHRELVEKNKEIEILTSKVQNNQSELENKLALTVNELAEEWSQRVDQRGTDVAESWKLHLESKETEFMQVEQQLKKEIFDLETKLTALINENNELRKNVDDEIRNEVDRVSALQQQIVESRETVKKLSQELQVKQQEVNTLNEKLLAQEIHLEKYEKDLEEKVKKIVSLEQLVIEKQNLLEKLKADQEKYTESFNETLQLLDQSQTELMKERGTRMTLEQVIEDNKLYSMSLSAKLKETEQQLDKANKTISAMQHQIGSHEEQIALLLKDLNERDSLINNYDLNQKSEIETLATEIKNKNSIIEQMQALISEKEREFAYHLEAKMKEKEAEIEADVQQLNTLKKRFGEVETNYEEILMAKESDLQSLQANLANQNKVIEEIKEALTIKEKECESLSKFVEEQKIKLDGYRVSFQQLEQQNEELQEENKQMEELHKIIEDQVLKIEEMKQQLFEKSKDYDSLIAEMEMQLIPKVSLANSDLSDSQIILPEENQTRKREDNEPVVSRAELDIALYMLHQRDVRCEELTVELVQLLEERDTLQLKLSNALREKETIRNKMMQEENEMGEKETSHSTGTVSKIVSGATGTELATESTEKLDKINKDALTSKLCELKSVSYRKDKTILDEQEQRRLQEFSLIRQYQEDGARLPPEAAAKLVQDANYTLSRDVQSPSKVLLDWLWGRSTPKVNDNT